MAKKSAPGSRTPKLASPRGPGANQFEPTGPIDYIVELHPDTPGIPPHFERVGASSPAEAYSKVARTLTDAWLIYRLYVAVEPVAWQPLDDATGSPLKGR